MLRCLPLAFFFVLLTVVAHADVLVLKSGERVSGKVVERTDKGVKFTPANGGLTVIYPYDQIDKILREEPVRPEDVKEDPPREERRAVPPETEKDDSSLGREFVELKKEYLARQASGRDDSAEMAELAKRLNKLAERAEEAGDADLAGKARKLATAADGPGHVAMTEIEREIAGDAKKIDRDSAAAFGAMILELAAPDTARQRKEQIRTSPEFQQTFFQSFLPFKSIKWRQANTESRGDLAGEKYLHDLKSGDGYLMLEYDEKAERMNFLLFHYHIEDSFSLERPGGDAGKTVAVHKGKTVQTVVTPVSISLTPEFARRALDGHREGNLRVLVRFKIRDVSPKEQTDDKERTAFVEKEIAVLTSEVQVIKVLVGDKIVY